MQIGMHIKIKHFKYLFGSIFSYFLIFLLKVTITVVTENTEINFIRIFKLL